MDSISFPTLSPPPHLGAFSPLLLIHRPLSKPPSPSTSYAALPLASQNPKARPSAVGARAEHQAEGTEPGACLLQFRAGHRYQGDIRELLQCLQGGHEAGRGE